MTVKYVNHLRNSIAPKKRLCAQFALNHLDISYSQGTPQHASSRDRERSGQRKYLSDLVSAVGLYPHAVVPVATHPKTPLRMQDRESQKVLCKRE